MKETELMRRIASVFVTTTTLMVATAFPAAAAYAPPAPLPGGTQGGAGGTAFTGSDLSVGVVLLGALVVVGFAALLIGRRAAARR
jgi:hypothetical protein